MAPSSPVQQPTSGWRDRPWLLASNRRLRNLISISFRNISLHAHSAGRPRGKTIDDDAVPNALTSPAKLTSLREQPPIHLSRSSTDLKRVKENGEAGSLTTELHNTAQSDLHYGQATGRPRDRPSLSRQRRRSMLEWVNANPQKRQDRLESITKDKLVDCFYTIHVDQIEEPIYISEVAHETMNPNFKHIDFSAIGPSLTRLDTITVRLWVRPPRPASWRILLESPVKLTTLQYIGKDLDTLKSPLPLNAVVFHLTDGIYATITSLSDYSMSHPAPSTITSTSDRTLPTSGFDSLLRLAKLDDSIQDALATQTQIAADLERLVQANNDAFTTRDKVAEARDRLRTIEFAKRTVEKQVQKAQRQKNEKQESLRARRQIMQEDLAARAKVADQMVVAKRETPQLLDGTFKGKKTVGGQQRRICEDLQKCYPIMPIPKASLAFTIRGLHLPNSDELDKETPETNAASLGYVAHMILLLSFYLQQPLPYPVNPRSSRSTIEDPLSLLKTNLSTTAKYGSDASLRTYPLFSKGTPRFRFEYAVFLLNKDIQILLENCFNIRVLDLRHTLPNLKYLMYVATAGEGELPARKAGGVKGLLRAGVRPGSGGGRRNSNDSTSSALSGLLWPGDGNGLPKGALDSLRKNMGALNKTTG